MIAVCFVLPLLIWGGFIEVSNSPKWLMLSLALPVLLYWYRPRWTVCQVAGLAFLCWGGLTALWAESPALVLPALWQFGLLWVASLIGSGMTEPKMRRCLFAFCLAMVLNAGLAWLQKFHGLDIVPEVSRPAGTFGNGNWLAEAGLLAVITAIALGRPVLALAVVPAWILPLSRNALIAGGILSTLWLWKKTKAGAVVLALIGIGVGAYHAKSIDWEQSSVALRASLYANTAAMVLDHPMGVGLGNYWTAYPPYHDAVIPSPESGYKLQQRPRTAHNDAMTVLAETGPIGLFLLAMVLLRRGRFAWLIGGFFALGLFAFPLFQPVTGFLAFLVAGHCSRSLPVFRPVLRKRQFAAP